MGSLEALFGMSGGGNAPTQSRPTSGLDSLFGLPTSSANIAANQAGLARRQASVDWVNANPIPKDPSTHLVPQAPAFHGFPGSGLANTAWNVVNNPVNQGLGDLATGLVSHAADVGKTIGETLISSPALYKLTGAMRDTAGARLDQGFKDFRANKIGKDRLDALASKSQNVNNVVTGFGNDVGSVTPGRALSAGLEGAAAAATGGGSELAAAGTAYFTGQGALSIAKSLPTVYKLVTSDASASDKIRALTSTVAGAALVAFGAKHGAGELSSALEDHLTPAKAAVVHQFLTDNAEQLQAHLDSTNAVNARQIGGEQQVGRTQLAQAAEAAQAKQVSDLAARRQQIFADKNAAVPGSPMVRDVRTGANPVVDTRLGAEAGAPRTPGAPLATDITPPKPVETLKSGPIEVPKVAEKASVAQSREPVGAAIAQEAPGPGTQMTPLSRNTEHTFENAKVEKPGLISRARSEAKNLLNPVADYGKPGLQAVSDFRAKLGELSADLRPVAAESRTRQAVFDKMSNPERLKFINDTQHGIPAATPELRALQATYAKFNAEGAKVGERLNPNFNEMENYFTQSGVVSKKNAPLLAQKWMEDKSNMPGSLKGRTFPSVQEAVAFANKFDIPLRETNPETLFMNNHQAVLTSGRLNEFKMEQDAKGVDPNITQKIIDRYSGTGISRSAGYQLARQASGTLSNIQLAGAFHFTKTALEQVNNVTATSMNTVLAGHPLEGTKIFAQGMADVIKGFGYFKGKDIATDINKGVDNHYTEAFRLANFNHEADPRFRIDGLQKNLDELRSGQPVEVVKGVASSPLRLINSGMRPLMQEFVPAAKNAAMIAHIDAADAALGPNATAAERTLAYQKAGRTVDGMFGQMNQDNFLWPKTMRDIMALFMRSPGYGVGTLEQVGGGIKDLVQPHPVEGLATAKAEGVGAGLKATLPESMQSLLAGKGLTTRSAYAIAMTMNNAIAGTIATYLFTGHGPQQLIDYFYPPTGKTDTNGNKERLALPFYSKDVAGFIVNPGQTLANKAAPGLSEALAIGNNKDYKGDYIRNPNDSLPAQGFQLAKYLATANLPFSLQGRNTRVDKGLAATLESIGGINPAPGYITKSPFSEDLSATYHRLNGKTLTPEEAQAQADKTKANKAAGKYTSSQNNFYFDSVFKTDKAEALRLLQKASPQDIKDLGLDPNALKQSAAYTISSPKSTASPDQKAAAQKIIDYFGGGDTGKLMGDRKAAIAAKARATRAKNK